MDYIFFISKINWGILIQHFLYDQFYFQIFDKALLRTIFEAQI